MGKYISKRARRLAWMWSLRHGEGYWREDLFWAWVRVMQFAYGIFHPRTAAQKRRDMQDLLSGHFRK